MDIESNTDCSYDVLPIFVNGYQDSAKIRDFCGNISSLGRDKILRTASSRIMLRFISDDSRHHRGFKLAYRGLQRGLPIKIIAPKSLPCFSACGQIYHATQGQITSPGYPADYPHNSICQWEIAVQEGYHIELRFDMFDVQLSPNCSKDHLVVRCCWSRRNMAWLYLF